jgi:hypothetical protein
MKKAEVVEREKELPAIDELDARLHRLTVLAFRFFI